MIPTALRTISTQVCIVGGGPCGMMLGVLLARAGVDVVVLEKYKDFYRDFRGDTIHPSTLDLLFELGWLDAFLALPHDEIRSIGVTIGGETVELADLTHLRTHCKFVALMPQWDFLNFLAECGRRYPTFHLMMQTEAIGLVESGGETAGVRAKTSDAQIEIEAKLVVGADGRHSTIRALAGLTVENLGAPMDVLWMRIAKHPGEAEQRLGNDRHRTYARDDRPRRLLAVRLHHSQRLLRRTKGARHRGAAARPRGTRSCAARSRCGARRLVEGLDARGSRRPARTLVPSGPALHRRCSPCDVADRRHRNQSCNPRCGRRGEHPRRFAGIGQDAERRGTPSRPRAASLPHEGDAGFSSFRAGPGDRSDLAAEKKSTERRWLCGCSTSFRHFAVSPRA